MPISLLIAAAGHVLGTCEPFAVVAALSENDAVAWLALRFLPGWKFGGLPGMPVTGSILSASAVVCAFLVNGPAPRRTRTFGRL